MRPWTASLVAVLLVASHAVADAQPNCEAIPRGPARTDCYLGLSQFYRAQSDLAADRALAQSDAAWYRAIGVRYVLEGSVRKAANRVRITGQLVDTATGAHLWADRFDGGLGDIFDLQDQVTESVVGAIAPAVEKAEIERAKRTGPISALFSFEKDDHFDEVRAKVIRPTYAYGGPRYYRGYRDSW